MAADVFLIVAEAIWSEIRDTHDLIGQEDDGLLPVVVEEHLINWRAQLQPCRMPRNRRRMHCHRKEWPVTVINPGRSGGRFSGEG